MARYTIEDVEYPSVTQILDILDKPALKQWAVNCAIQYVKENMHKPFDELMDAARIEWKNVGREAMSIGSQVHNVIEQYIKFSIDKTEKPDIKDEVQNAFLAFLEWEKENIEEWIESEKTVVGPGYAGTLDAVAIFKNNKKYVIDFKSSKGIYDEYIYQIAAYRRAYTGEKNEKNIDGMGILRLDKTTGQPEWKDCSKVYEKKLDAFLKLVEFYYAAKKRKLKNNKKVV